MNIKRTRIATTLSLAVGFIVISAYAVNQQASVRGMAKSGNITLVVSASPKQVGTFDGRATFRDSQSNTRIDVRIDCIAFNNPALCPHCDPDAESATLSGVVTNSNDHFFPVDLEVGFTVQDHGHRNGSVPDQFTALETLKDRCRPLFFGFLDSESGQILVNSGE